MAAVSHAYGDGADRVLVLHDVSLHVGAGEVVCVAGPSGSGKTALCHLAAGFEVPDERHGDRRRHAAADARRLGRGRGAARSSTGCSAS